MKILLVVAVMLLSMPALVGSQSAQSGTMKKNEKERAVPGPKSGSKDLLTLDLGGGVKMDLLLIKPGAFTMGGGDDGREHRVTLTKGFHLGKTEVTQAQWEALMGSNPSKWKGADLPVEQVSWDDAQEFLKKLNEKAKAHLKGRTAVLPTEAQWEYACRAGAKSRYGFGDDEKELGDHGWFKDNSGMQTHPVGQKKPNAWGLHDMHGNVWEWCHDWDAPYGGDVVDPAGPESGSHRSLRGAGYGGPAIQCRSGMRNPHASGVRTSGAGFRVALP